MEENRNTLQYNIEDSGNASDAAEDQENVQAEADSDGVTGDAEDVNVVMSETQVFDRSGSASELTEAPETEENTAQIPQTEAAPEAETGEEEKEYGLPADHPEMGELQQKIQQRRVYKKKKERRRRTWVTFFTAILTFFAVTVIFSISGVFTVDSIEVKGNSHYSAEEIISMAHAVPGHNLLYNTGKKEIIDYLEQNPYIKSASVSRKLPSTLVISVKERKERLAFGYDDDYLVLDEDGILLRKTRNIPKTTLVEGNIVTSIKLGEVIGTEDGERFDHSLELIRTMRDADLYFVRIDMSDDKQIRAYIYDNLVVRTDYESLITNLKNDRLHQVVERLFEDGIKRGTITFAGPDTISFMPIIS